MSRPSWDHYFMGLATAAATRSTCDRAHVGCVVVASWANEVIATGYNGAPSGMPHCDNAGHLMVDGHCRRALHAEHNALQRAGDKGAGATVYVTHFPCIGCALELIEANVARVVYGTPYFVNQGQISLFEIAGISLEGLHDGRE